MFTRSNSYRFHPALEITCLQKQFENAFAAASIFNFLKPSIESYKMLSNIIPFDTKCISIHNRIKKRIRQTFASRNFALSQIISYLSKDFTIFSFKRHGFPLFCYNRKVERENMFLQFCRNVFFVLRNISQNIWHYHMIHIIRD